MRGHYAGLSRWRRVLGRRLRLLVRRSRVDAEMAEEMRHHLEELVREHMQAGRSEAEARRAALLEFGGVERMQEAGRDARGGRWMADAGADLRYSVRQMRCGPFATAAMLAVLALGVAAAGLAFAVARGYLYRPLPVPDAERLAYVLGGRSRDPVEDPPDLRGVDWSAAAAPFAEPAGWDLDGFTIVDGDTPEYVSGAWVSPGYFELLGIGAIRGRLFTPDEYTTGNRVAVIGHELWRTRFEGADSIIGAAIRLHSTDRPNEEELVTIVGVLAAPAWNLNDFQHVLRPLGTDRRFSLVRVPAGSSLDEGAARLTAAVRAQVEVADPTWRMGLVSALDEHVYRVRPTIHVLVAIAGLLLLLSIASVGSMLLARWDERAHELAVRKAIGAGPSRLIRQLAVEAGALWVLATAAGLAVTGVLAATVAGQVERFGGVQVPAGVAAVRLDAVVVAGIVCASMVPFLLVAVAPMIRVLRSGASGLRLTTRASGSGRTAATRRALVVAQVALAVALLINASLLARSVGGMTNAPLGFDAGDLLKAHLLLPRTRYPEPADRSRAIEAILARVRAAPGVLGATAVHPHPFRGTTFTEIECDGCGVESTLRVTPQVITPTYFADLAIPAIAGRGFDVRDDAESAPVAVVSAGLARELGGSQRALGQRVRIRSVEPDGPWFTVVGVVGDVRKTFGDTLYSDLYVPFAQHPRAYTAVFVRTAQGPMSAAPAIRQAVAANDPALALSDVEPMEEVLAARRGPQVILASFGGAAATLALILTVCALYAVIAYLTSRRRKEFALRLALGAGARSIVGLVVGDGLRLITLGVVAGVALAAAGGTLLRARLFGVAPLDGASYGWALSVVAVVSLIALIVPAVRAGARSPAGVLREDG
jgi:predicted permease